MNARLLLMLFMFSQLPLQARIVKTLSDLNKGDWFYLEYTQFFSSPEGKKSLRNAEIFEFLVTVTDRTGSDLRFSITPSRVRYHKTFYAGNEKYENNPAEIFAT